MSDESNVPNPYHRVIDVLTSDPINYLGMVRVLAKHFPDVFVQVNAMMAEAFDAG